MNTIPGEFIQQDSFGPNSNKCAMLDADLANGIGQPYKTPGVVRTADINLQPSLVQSVSVIGWTASARLGVPSVGVQSYGILGSLWIGIAVDASIPNAGGADMSGHQVPGVATFPADLSGFSQVWDGSTDTINRVANGLLVDPNESDYALVADTFMLPTPIKFTAGNALQMVAVLTPSKLSNGLYVIIQSIKYSVIYQ